MIRIYYALIMILLSLSTIAQPWLQNLPATKSQANYSLFDHKNAFDEYWQPFNVNNKGKYLKDGVEVKAPGWKQFNRWYHNMEAQVDPTTGAFPEKSVQEVYEAYLKAQVRTKGTLEDRWTGIGPSSSTGGYSGVGRINCIAFHPSDNNTYWVGAPAGGLWKTTDNGSSWTCLTDDNAVLGVSDIIIPSNYVTSTTIYIATGDRDGSDNRSVGVLKSTNGGTTWNATDLAYSLSDNDMVNRLLLDPANDDVIIAATSNGVYKTTNGGTNWSTQLSYREFIDMEYKPGDFSTLYGSNTIGAIYVSTDNGATWLENFSDGSVRRIEIAVTPDNSSVVYAIAAGEDYGLKGIYKSINSGSDFSQTFDGATSNLMGWFSDGSGSGGQGWYDLSIAVSPTNEDVVLVGGVISHKSTDGGSTWNCSNCWTGSFGYNYGDHPVVHADKHNLTYRSNGDLFECNDGGVYISTNDGTSWTDKSNGLVNSQMYKLGVSQNTAGEIITGLQDNGTKLYSDGLWEDVKGGDGMECLIDYTDDDIQYGTYVRGQITRTMNHWSSTKNIEPSAAGSGAWVTPYIIDPTSARTIYAGYADVWKTTNRGDNWTKISSINFPNKIRSMAIAPSDTKVLYVAGLSSIYTTTNGGGEWSDITNSLPVESGYIQSVTVKHTDANTIWVTLSGYNSHAVYESTNGGSSWTNISTGLPEIPAYSLVQNKSTEKLHLYVGTELGIYYKKGSDNWVAYNTGLPNVKIGELEIYYGPTESDSRLRAATYGRGLWESPIEFGSLKITSVSTLNPDSAYRSGESIQIDVEYESAVDVDITNGTPRIKLNTDPVKYAVYSGSTQSGITSLPFVYTVGSDENAAALDYATIDDLTLEGATIMELDDDVRIKLPEVGTFSSNHNIVIDNISPTVYMTSTQLPTAYAKPIVVDVVFNEDMIGFELNDVIVSEGVATDISGEGKNYVVYVIPNDDVEVAIDINAGIASDLAGNLNDVAQQFTINYGVVPPEIILSSLEGRLTTKSPFELIIEFDIKVADFKLEDLSIINGEASNLVEVETGIKFTIDITPIEEYKDIEVVIEAGKVYGTSGLGNELSNTFVTYYDGTAPTMTMEADVTSPTNVSSFNVQIEIDELPLGFTVDDIEIINGIVSNFTKHEETYFSMEITPISGGQVITRVRPNTFTDSAGNINATGNMLVIDVDYISPSLTLTTLENEVTNANPVQANIVFSELINGFELTDLVVSNGVASELVTVVENREYVFDVVPLQDGIVSVGVILDSISDLASNLCGFSKQLQFEYDDTKPSVTISTEGTNPTNQLDFYIDIEFNEPVSGFELNDLKVENGILSDFSIVEAGIKYSALATIEQEGEFTVEIISDMVVDAVGIGNAASNKLIVMVDTTVPVFTVIENTQLSSLTSTMRFALNESGTVHYALIHSELAFPTAQQVVDNAVSDALAFGLIDFENAEPKDLHLDGLEGGTNYSICLVIIDYAGNQSQLVSDEFTTWAVSVSENNMWGINLYPNPSVGKFFVEFNDTDVIGREMTIVNALGKIIATRTINALKERVEIENISSGNYFIVIATDKDKKSFQFTVE